MEIVEEKVRKTVLFIDLPNLVYSARQFRYEVNAAFFKLFDLAKQHGKIVEGFAYGDLDRPKLNFSVQRALISQNIRLIHCPGNGSGESKIDDPMLVEGIHSVLRRNSDFFYALVSSDIMLLPVSMTLRSLSKDFRIYGFSQCASPLLRGLPEFIDFSRFLENANSYYPIKKNETSEKVAS